MKKILITTSLCTVLALPGQAQQVTFGSIDTNNDGQLSREELEGVFGTEGADNVLGNQDKNKDGFITVDEAVSGDDEDDDEDDDDDSEDDDEDDAEDDEGDDDDDGEGDHDEGDSDGEGDGEGDGDGDGEGDGDD